MIRLLYNLLFPIGLLFFLPALRREDAAPRELSAQLRTAVRDL